MSSNIKITFEDWLADNTFEEYHFNRELQDQRYQISIQRLILEKKYRGILKKREFIESDTFKKIENAQKKSFDKVKDSLLKAQLERIESQKANSNFLKIRLKNLQNWLLKIENEYPKIIENVYEGHDYSAFIWGGVYKEITNTTIDKNFRFTEFANDDIQSFGEPNPNYIEELTSFNELNYRLKRAEILDLNIEIYINSQQTNLLLSLLNDTNKSSPQVGDRRGDNMKDHPIVIESLERIRLKIAELFEFTDLQLTDEMKNTNTFKRPTYKVSEVSQDEVVQVVNELSKIPRFLSKNDEPKPTTIRDEILNKNLVSNLNFISERAFFDRVKDAIKEIQFYEAESTS